MSSDDIDVAKLKLPELRAELSKRGLNTFGTRQALVDRLTEAMNSAALLPASNTSLRSDDAPFASSETKMDADEMLMQAQNSGCDIGNGTSDQRESPDPRQRSDMDHKRKRSPSPRKRSRSRDRDGRRSPRHRSRSPSSRSRMCDEKPGWEDNPSVFLDSYNCDLSLMLDADGFSAKPQTDGGFSMMWAGVRANYGLISGKAFFEVKCLRHLAVDNLDSLAGGAPHVTRIGWSTENTDFALGEEPQSYGYGGTGKKSCNNKFCDYGCAFGEGDVVGAFLEWTQSEALIRFSVNGIDQGECYRIQKCTLGEKPALFPHVYVKNVEFTVNFGQGGQPPWFAPNIPKDDPSSWLLMNNVNPVSRVRGRKPPSSKSECEVIMMIGLPGSGKTYYAERFRSENRDKQFNVLGTNLILDKMKVMGLARQRNYHGRWDVLIDKATKCLNALITMASMRRRNYILDQTNVYPSAQRRKMRPFEGFKRKAIVIVPTDEEFRRRIAQREKEEGKEVPESAVLEMKANFGIPKPLSEDPSSVFDEVLFTELNATEAKELVEKYNQEGQANRPPPEKRQRWDGGRDQDDSRDSRFRGYETRDRGRDYGRGRRDDFRRSPRRDDRGRWEYRGGYNADRDRSRDTDRYDRGRDRDSYGRSSDRFGGSGGRFGGPGRGTFPPGMNYGGYGAPRGGGVTRGHGPPVSPGTGRGYGGPAFHSGGGPPVEYRGMADGRPPRGGRGGFRGGPGTGYSGPVDSGYSSHGQYDAVPVKTGPDSYNAPGGSSFPSITNSQPPPDGTSGYRGGYGPPGRGHYGGSDSAGYGGQTMARGGGIVPGRGGRGAGSGDRDETPVARGGSMPRGVPAGRGGFSANARGAYQTDQDPSGYPLSGAERSSFNSYSGADDYSERSRDRFPPGDAGSYGSAGQPVKSAPSFPAPNQSGYSGGYHRGGPVGYSAGGQQSYPASTYSSESQAAYSGNFADSEGYPNSAAPEGIRGTRQPNRAAGGSHAGSSRGYPPSDTEKPPTELQHNERTPDGGSLYASGSARYGETHASQSHSSGPKQSRFDSKPASTGQQGYSNYSQSGYSEPYGTMYGAGGMNSNPTGVAASNTSASMRTGRSRFDIGPNSNQTAPASSAVPQNAPSQQPLSGQSQQPSSQSSAATSYYGYGTQSSKQPTAVSAPVAPNHSLGSYGYNYGGYSGSYTGQASQPTTTQSRPSVASNSTPSLYASAVSDKPSASLPPLSTTQSSSVADNSTAAYTSYYGYGSAAATGATGIMADQQANAGKLDAAMAAAQQFNTWQQQPPPPPSGISAATPTTTVAQTPVSATSAYAGYYAGFAAYPTGYGATGAPAPPASQVMPPYYGGYR